MVRGVVNEWGVVGDGPLHCHLTGGRRELRKATETVCSIDGSRAEVGKPRLNLKTSLFATV
jgi:hypothetical protein